MIPNGRLTIAEGAIRPFNRINTDAWYTKKLQAVADRHGFSLHVPTSELTDEQLNLLMYGTGNEKYSVSLGSGRTFETTYEGVVNNLERRHKETDSDFIRRDIERFMQERPCHACKGKRLKPEVLAVTVGTKSIMDICDLSIDEAIDYFKSITLSDKEQHIAAMIFKEITARLQFLQDVGLNYLNLLRSAATLSGGEAQRIRLATQIGSGLQGVLYVLDEPSIGLHQRDNERLIRTLKHLRDIGNSVLVVEQTQFVQQITCSTLAREPAYTVVILLLRALQTKWLKPKRALPVNTSGVQRALKLLLNTARVTISHCRL